MVEEGLHSVAWLGLTVLFLIGLGIFFPSNAITGNVVLDNAETCGTLGCVELCDTDAACSNGEVCCTTNWNTGVCDLEASCNKILEYSQYQSLEAYQDSTREQPSPIGITYSGFWMPLIVVFFIILYFVFRRRNMKWK